MQNIYTAPQIAKMLGLTDARIYQLARQRKLGTRKGKTILFSRKDLANLQVRVNGRPKKTYRDKMSGKKYKVRNENTNG